MVESLLQVHYAVEYLLDVVGDVAGGDKGMLVGVLLENVVYFAE